MQEFISPKYTEVFLEKREKKEYKKIKKKTKSNTAYVLHIISQ